MGMLAGLMLNQAITLGTVSLTTQTISNHDPNAPFNSAAGVQVNSNANMYKRQGTAGSSLIQINSGTDWLRGADPSPGLWQVRGTITSGTLTTAPSAIWRFLSAGSLYWENFTSTEFGSESGIILLELRYNGGSIVESASYTLIASAGDL